MASVDDKAAAPVDGPEMVEGWYVDHQTGNHVAIEKYVLFKELFDAEQWVRENLDEDNT